MSNSELKMFSGADNRCLGYGRRDRGIAGSVTRVAAEYDAFVITGELAFEDVLNEPFPGHNYIPSEYPGLF